MLCVGGNENVTAYVDPCAGAFLERDDRKTAYKGEGDFLFPSERLNGAKPLTPDMVLKKIIRPALDRANVKGKVIGWHSFRHSLATNLRSLGVDVKVAQELLRHANSRITMDWYTQAISSDKRSASGRQIDLLLGNEKGADCAQHPSAPLKLLSHSGESINPSAT